MKRSPRCGSDVEAERPAGFDGGNIGDVTGLDGGNIGDVTGLDDLLLPSISS